MSQYGTTASNSNHQLIN